jgi:hypothetical protein
MPGIWRGQRRSETIDRLLQTTQQTKYLTPMQAACVGNTKTTRLNPQQHLKPTGLLLALRHHRHGAPSGPFGILRVDILWFCVGTMPADQQIGGALEGRDMCHEL